MTEDGGRVPAAEIWNGTATPAELAGFDQARAGAKADLATLLAEFTRSVQALPGGRDRVLARYSLGLYEWEHLHLALALVEALNELEVANRGRS